MLDNQLKEKKCIIFGGKTDLWKIDSSSTAKNCKNYIRQIVDTLDLQPNPEKPVVALSIGDPTVYGNLKPSEESVQAVIDVIQEGACNGYAPCVGYEKSREAVADYLSYDGVKFQARDIILCSGCSSSLEIAITALCDERKNHNLLMPRPGFSIYRTLAEAIGVNVKYYNLLPEQNWEIDLAHLESQIDQNTAVIILNNPSNPCGSVYSEEHLRNVLEIAYTHRIPVIADEIYERIVFSGSKFVSTASLNSRIPILICGGLAKRFLAPGWRLGWIAIHDEVGAFDSEIRKALTSLSQRIIGSNTLIQGALPAILQNTPQNFHDNLINILEKHAKLAFEILRNVRGLAPFMPQGTMYMMVEVHFNKFPFKDGLHFVTKLMEEESVFCLPGDCFQLSGFMRIVLTVPEDLLLEACNRISEFCNRHYV
ncbi:tyrosine aminotransferase, partial [Asbolus verrucosus]